MSIEVLSGNPKSSSKGMPKTIDIECLTSPEEEIRLTAYKTINQIIASQPFEALGNEVAQHLMQNSDALTMESTTACQAEILRICSQMLKSGIIAPGFSKKAFWFRLIDKFVGNDMLEVRTSSVALLKQLMGLVNINDVFSFL